MTLTEFIIALTRNGGTVKFSRERLLGHAQFTMTLECPALDRSKEPPEQYQQHHQIRKDLDDAFASLTPQRADHMADVALGVLARKGIEL